MNIQDEKEFDKWNGQKKDINKTINRISFKERDIWNVKIGKNVGFEENGRGEEFLRPVLILKKFSSESFLGIPLTSVEKTEYPQFYQTFYFKDKVSIAILTQVKLFSTKRLQYLMGRISDKKFNDIKQKLIKLIT